MLNAIKNTFSGPTAKPNTQELSEPTNNKIASDYKKQAYWIEWAALLIELFAFSLVVAWAWNSQSHWLLASICVGAFVGFQIARIYTVPLLVNAIKSKHYGMVVLGFILVFATLLVLFAATVFENVNKSDEGVNERVLNSPAMKALELEIGQTRDKIASLAAFSNPEKAHAETQELKANEAARLAKIEKTKGQINSLLNSTPKNKAGDSAGNTLSAATAGCTNGNWYDKTYCGEVRNLKAQLKSLENGSAGGDASYNARYDEYNGLQTHLTSLEKQRAELLTSQGEGVINAYRPEDTLIASLFGINPQTASFSKWLVFSAVLDLLGLGLRFLASMARFRASGVPDLHEQIRKLKAFATLYGMEQLDNLLNNQTKVTYHGAPALTAPAQREERKTSREAQQFDDLPMPMTASAEPAEPPKKFGFGFVPTDAEHTSTTCLHGNDNMPMPYVNGNKGNDNMSMTYANDNKGNDNKGNDKKTVGGTYSCVACGNDYQARTVWQKKCPDCSASTKRSVMRSKKTT